MSDDIRFETPMGVGDHLLYISRELQALRRENEFMRRELEGWRSGTFRYFSPLERPPVERKEPGVSR